MRYAYDTAQPLPHRLADLVRQIDQSAGDRVPALSVMYITDNRPKLAHNPAGNLSLWERPMLHLVEPNRTYDPETVAAMTDAFDKVCRSVSKWMNGNDDVKQTLALIILRHVDKGVRDPQRLADIALCELAADRAVAGGRSSTG